MTVFTMYGKSIISLRRRLNITLPQAAIYWARGITTDGKPDLGLVGHQFQVSTRS